MYYSYFKSKVSILKLGKAYSNLNTNPYLITVHYTFSLVWFVLGIGVECIWVLPYNADDLELVIVGRRVGGNDRLKIKLGIWLVLNLGLVVCMAGNGQKLG